MEKVSVLGGFEGKPGIAPNMFRDRVEARFGGFESKPFLFGGASSPDIILLYPSHQQLVNEIMKVDIKVESEGSERRESEKCMREVTDV